MNSGWKLPRPVLCVLFGKAVSIVASEAISSLYLVGPDLPDAECHLLLLSKFAAERVL